MVAVVARESTLGVNLKRKAAAAAAAVHDTTTTTTTTAAAAAAAAAHEQNKHTDKTREQSDTQAHAHKPFAHE